MNSNLGAVATDSITGFKGSVVGFCQYVTGCDQYLVLPKCGKDGAYPKGQWIDVTRLSFKLIPSGKFKSKAKKKKPSEREPYGPDMSPGLDSEPDDTQDGEW